MTKPRKILFSSLFVILIAGFILWMVVAKKVEASLRTKLPAKMEVAFLKLFKREVRCVVESIDISNPFSMKIKNVSCEELGQDFIAVDDLRLSVMPESQVISGKIKDGTFELKTKAKWGINLESGPKILSKPKYIDLELMNIHANQIAPIYFALLHKMNPRFPEKQTLHGLVTGHFEIPINFQPDDEHPVIVPTPAPTTFEDWIKLQSGFAAR